MLSRAKQPSGKPGSHGQSVTIESMGKPGAGSERVESCSTEESQSFQSRASCSSPSLATTAIAWPWPASTVTTLHHCATTPRQGLQGLWDLYQNKLQPNMCRETITSYGEIRGEQMDLPWNPSESLRRLINSRKEIEGCSGDIPGMLAIDASLHDRFHETPGFTCHYHFYKKIAITIDHYSTIRPLSITIIIH